MKLIKAFKTTILVALCCINYSVIADTADNEKDSKLWITIGTDALSLMKSDSNKPFEILDELTPLNKSTISVVALSENQVDSLSKFMHKNFNRCGGFFVHDSKVQAVEYSAENNHAKSSVAFTYTINNGESVNALLSQANPSNMSSTVSGMSDYNNRYYTQQSGVNASQWLRDQWTNIASTRSDITVELYQHSGWVQPSVIATINGTTNPEEIVVIGGHLDSINRNNPSNGRAPGADDNASGIAVITETLSAIVASDYRPARTLKIMGYAAEEVGLRGSSDIAKKFKSDNLNVVGVAQFDMTGHNGSQDDIVFISDYTNAAQTQFMADLLDTYFANTTYGFSNCGYACSDHASWNAEGFAASFPFEAHFNDSNSAIHTSSDTQFNELHATKFLNLSIAYVAELTKGTIGQSNLSSLQFDNGNEIVSNEEQVIMFTVTRSGNLNDSVSIDYATESDSAVAGVDFDAALGTLAWDSQDSASKTFSVSVKAVNSAKVFSVNLTNPQGGASVGPNSRIDISLIPKVDNTVVTPPPQSSSGSGSMGGFLLILLGLVFGGGRTYRVK